MFATNKKITPNRLINNNGNKKTCFHFIEIESSFQAGIDIKSTSPEHLIAIREAITVFFPEVSFPTLLTDLEDGSVIGMGIKGIESARIFQTTWWLIRQLCKNGWEILDVEYLSPSDIIYILKTHC